MIKEYFVRSQVEPGAITPPADRAQRLREMMERQWREPGLINARKRSLAASCRSAWAAIMAIGIRSAAISEEIKH